MGLFENLRRRISKGKEETSAPVDSSPPVTEDLDTSFRPDRPAMFMAEHALQGWKMDPSNVSAWLKTSCPEWYERVIASPEIRHLLHLADFDVAVQLVGDTQGLQFADFDPLNSEVCVPLVEVGEKLPLQFIMMIHDSSHYARGGILPVKRDALEKLRQDPSLYEKLSYEEIIGDKQTFVDLVINDEAEAIYISDVLLPHLIGHNDTREALGVPSIGEVLLAAGFTALEDQKRVLKDIFLHDQIDERLQTYLPSNAEHAAVIDALRRRSGFDHETTEQRFESQTKREKLLPLVARALSHPFAVDLDTAVERRDAGWNFPPSRGFSDETGYRSFLALMNASLRADLHYQWLLKLNPLGLPSSYPQMRAKIVDGIQELYKSEEVDEPKFVKVLSLMFSGGMVPYDFADGPGGFREVNSNEKKERGEYPSLGLVVPEKLSFAFPSNHAVQGWESWVTRPEVPTGNGDETVSRPFVSFIEMGGVPLQLNRIDLWPDARAYGYVGRGEQYEDPEPYMYSRGVVSRLPGFPHKLISRVATAESFTDKFKELAGGIEHSYLNDIFNFGFSHLGLREFSRLRRDLLLTPRPGREEFLTTEREGVFSADQVYGSLSRKDITSPLVSPYGHRVLESMLRNALGPMQLVAGECDIKDFPALENVLFNRMLQREIAAIFISHMAPDLWAAEFADRRGFLPSKNSFSLFNREGETLDSKRIAQILLGESPPDFSHPQLVRWGAEWASRGGEIKRIAHSKVALQLVYPFRGHPLHALESLYRTNSEIALRSSALASRLDAMVEREEGFPAFALNSFKRRTLFPVITYLSIIGDELRRAVDDNPTWLRGGQFHAKTFSNLVNAYVRELNKTLNFYETEELTDEDGDPSLYGRQFHSTGGTIDIDAMIDGGTRLVNRVLWNMVGLLDVTVDSRHLAPEGISKWQEVMHGSDPFGALEYVAHAFSRIRTGENPAVLLEPCAIDIPELVEVMDLTPDEMYARRRDVTWSIYHLEAEREHDVEGPDSSPFSEFNWRMLYDSEELYSTLEQFGREGFYTVGGIYPRPGRAFPDIRLDGE